MPLLGRVRPAGRPIMRVARVSRDDRAAAAAARRLLLLPAAAAVLVACAVSLLASPGGLNCQSLDVSGGAGVSSVGSCSSHGVSSATGGFSLLPSLPVASAYRIHNQEENVQPTSAAFFPPYVDGFVGRMVEPANPGRIRVNEGNQFSLTQPNLFDGVLPRQECPGMVGPMLDKMFYCTREEAGYCDRRSGTCLCYYGYRGDACEECAFTHYRDEDDGLCKARVLCPNDCSGMGECDYTTGTCHCTANRVPPDCSERFCAVNFDPRCQACDEFHCSRCSDGFYIQTDPGPDEDKCLPCTDWDPRCIFCSNRECLVCGDPLLLSIRRSGARRDDTPLPFDEFDRELSIALPFGTQSRYAFEEAEPFIVNPDKDAPPLGTVSQSCSQGINNDDEWSCSLTPQSHQVCGHPGTFSFDSPSFSVWENTTFSRVKVRRTGGGLGLTGVKYFFQHNTTSTDDVSETAYYTTSQELVFEDGVIEKTFLITINDDTTVEANETFALILQSPFGSASLGPQRQTFVTIHDDDWEKTNHLHCTAAGAALSLPNVAGEVALFTVTAGTPSGESLPGERFVVETIDPWALHAGSLGANGTKGEFDYTTEWELRTNQPVKFDQLDNEDGTYDVSARPTVQGTYGAVVQLATPRGLLGEYFDNAYLHGERAFYRIDHVVNFTWGDGRITKHGTDYTSARWTGRVLSQLAGGLQTYTFYVNGDDNIRLWIDYELIVDRWESFAGMSYGVIRLAGDTLYDIRLEHRDRTGPATCQLFWSRGTPFAKDPEVIPSENLFAVRHIPGSPFDFTTIAASANTYGSFCSGAGLLGTTAGVTAYFDIHSRDEYLNDRLEQGVSDTYEVTLNYLDIDLITELPESDGFGGTYIGGFVQYDPETHLHKVSYTPHLSGTYDLNVKLRTGVNTFTHIQGSPFRVEVEPAAMSGVTSDIWGDGVEGGTAGDPFVFNIRSRDMFHNLRGPGEPEALEIQDVQVSWKHVDIFHEQSLRGTVGEVHWADDGDYVGTWWPTGAGTHILSVTVGGNHIAASPYTVEVEIDEVFGGTSVADGVGLHNCTSNELVAFTVYLRDRYYNPLNFADGTVVALLSGPDDVTAVTTQNGDGTVLVEYVPTKWGTYDLDVSIAGVPIAGSPFHPHADPGVTFGSTTSAEGVGLTDATAGIEASFVVQARDLNANDKQTWQGADDVTVWLEVDVLEPNEDGVIVTVTKTVQGASTGIGNGQYLCTYTATVADVHELYIEINGEAIIDTPFHPLVIPAKMNATLSVATGSGLVAEEAGQLAPVYLKAVDEFNNDLLRAGDGGEIIAWLDHDTEPGLTLPMTVHDLANGSYYLPWYPIVTGDYTLHMDLMVKGGLTATYFARDDFLGPVATLIDSHIDFDWSRTMPLGVYNATGHSPGTLDTTPHAEQTSASGATHDVIIETAHRAMNDSEHFSVRWEGNLRPDKDEWYTFVVDVEGDVRLYLDGEQLIDAWPASTSRYRASLRLNAGQFYALRLDYRTHVGPSSVSLSWSSASFAPEATDNSPGDEIVSSDYFYLRYPITGGTFHPHVRPAPTSPSNCEAWGTGLAVATANIQSSFTVHLRDEFNNTREVGGDLVQAVAERTGPGPPPADLNTAIVQVEADVQDLGDAHFLVTYTPVVNGFYSLRVTVNAPPVHTDLGPTAVDASVAPGHIQDSPFLLDVSDGVAVGDQSSPVGSGLTEAEAGVQTGFTVQVRDVNHNDRTDGLDSLSIVGTRDTPAVSLAGFETPVTLTGVATYVDAGLYDVRYTAAESGQFSLAVLVNGEPAIGSPFDLLVSPTYAHGPLCTAFEPQLTPVSREVAVGATNDTLDFVIHSKDRFGNYMLIGGDKYVVRAIGPEKYPRPIRGFVVDNGDGTYGASFTPEIPGPYLVTVLLARTYVADTGLTGEYYDNQWMRGDPVVVRIDAEVDFDWTSGGDGMGALITAGWSSTFSSVRWTGFVESEHPEYYTFHVASDDGARLWIGNELLIDALELGPGERSGTTAYQMIPGQLYEVRLEYRQMEAEHTIRLEWQSTNTARSVVPTEALFPNGAEIKDSPFDVRAEDP